MIDRLRETRVTPAGWADLTGELDRWREAGREATLWWRDDDAATAGDRLDRLLAVAGEAPVTFAVIPGLADASLAARLAGSPRCGGVVQHGWLHVDHAAGGKKSEFPPTRPRAAAAADLARGRTRMTELFGGAALAVLAPPWNRFDDGLLLFLAECGIGALSRVKPRRAVCPAPGVLECNVHVDLVAWAGDRGFIGREAALSGIVGHLRARRRGQVDSAEPTGILTHHLVQDAAADAFLRRLVAIVCAHPAARWLAAGEVFAPPPAAAA